MRKLLFTSQSGRGGERQLWVDDKTQKCIRFHGSVVPTNAHYTSALYFKRKPLSFICLACQTPKLLKWSVVLDKVVCAVNKGQECIKRPNPFACNGYPGFVIAKVHSFKLKRLVSPESCFTQH